jgi:hypothetical protein
VPGFNCSRNHKRCCANEVGKTKTSSLISLLRPSLKASNQSLSNCPEEINYLSSINRLEKVEMADARGDTGGEETGPVPERSSVDCGKDFGASGVEVALVN